MPKYTHENTYAIGKPVKVFLDGVEVDGNRCDEADTDEGYVIMSRVDAHGGVFVKDDEIATERFDGRVVVELVNHA